jgi:hypothetical protein
MQTNLTMLDLALSLAVGVVGLRNDGRAGASSLYRERRLPRNDTGGLLRYLADRSFAKLDPTFVWAPILSGYGALADCAWQAFS